MGLRSYIAKVLNIRSTMNTTSEIFETVCYADACSNLKDIPTLAGNIKGTMSMFYLSPERMAQVWIAVSSVVVWEELFLFFVLGFLLPFALKSRSGKTSSSDPHSYSIGQTITSNIAQICQLAFAVYMVDILKVILQSVGFDFCMEGELSHAFANILYLAWILTKVSSLKRYLLARQTKCSPDNLTGQVQLVDRLVDTFIYGVGLYVALDVLSVQEDMGAAAKGFVALGSVGTMVLGLASQGLAAQLFNGLFLASSNRIAVGDYVKFGNGVSGTVIKLGWMETVIRGPDEIFVTVPNKDLADQRVSNMSRVKQCAVKQKLRFKYADIDKLPNVLESIKEEVKKACPEVITDGSRPFRAFLTGYHADHISAQLDFRFRLKPLGDAFHRNRQTVLLVISKVAKEYGVEFAVVDVAAVTTAVKLLTAKED